MDIGAVTAQIREKGAFISRLREEVGRVIVGQRELVDTMLIALLADGHLLVEGVPGLAKTLAISTLASTLSGSFKRVQFTPDLLPADITGTLVYNPGSGEFTAKKGPIFANFILADEVNRAPAKVQSALLEAMQEKQVTLGDTTYQLERPFLVMATQNPIEQEGTYPLPEAQVYRFMMKAVLTYPTRSEEREIIARMGGATTPTARPAATLSEIMAARESLAEIYVDPKVEEYIVNLVFATREPSAALAGLIAAGASPRATLALIKCSRAHAFLAGRGYVTPEDVKAVGFDVLRHRITPTYEAEAEGVTAEELVRRVFDSIEVP